MRRRFLLVLTLVASIESACVGWQPIASAKASDGKKEIIIWELKDFPDSVVSITLKTPNGDETLLRDGTERIVKSARIAWTKDSTVFVARVFCGGEDLIFAYDTNARHPLDVKAIKKELKDEAALVELVETQEEWEEPSRR